MKTTNFSTLLLILTSFFALTWSVPGQNRIVFDRYNSDTDIRDIFIMDANGGFPRNLTKDTSWYGSVEPAISPDGKRIAFSSDNPGPVFAITVMDLGGIVIRRQITDGFYNDHTPDWSPDGQKIAFGRCYDTPDRCDIYTVKPDGSSLTQLTNTPGTDDDIPRFSPDGSKILFMSNRDGNYELYVCNTDGSNVLRLTTNISDDGWANWSPDGTKIIFSSRRDGAALELYLMDALGGNVTRLTQGSNWSNFGASFSSNGQRVVWARKFGSDSPYEIVEAPLENMNQFKRLTNNNIQDSNPRYGFVTRKVGRVRY